MKNVEILDLPEDAIRQYIDARQTFLALEQAKARAAEYRGGMIWKQVGNKTYLVRTSARGNQKGLGAQTDETEAMYDKFITGKKQAEDTVRKLKDSILRQQRLNRALRVGRTPNIIIEILSKLNEAGMTEHFTVIGTNALYAYETVASVRIDESNLATRDFDLLWDNRKTLSLVINEQSLANGMLGFLKKIDSSFSLRHDQLYTAVNSDGYEVDILRKVDKHKSGEPARLSAVEDDFWVVQAKNADWLLSAPKFSEVVVGVNGNVARMTTVDPRAFVLFKLWMSGQKDRERGKRLRDKSQAAVVAELITSERLAQFSFEDLKIFPQSVRNLFEGLRD